MSVSPFDFNWIFFVLILILIVLNYHQESIKFAWTFWLQIFLSTSVNLKLIGIFISKLSFRIRVTMIANVKNVLMMTTIPRYSIEELEYLTPKRLVPTTKVPITCYQVEILYKSTFYTCLYFQNQFQTNARIDSACRHRNRLHSMSGQFLGIENTKMRSSILISQINP